MKQESNKIFDVCMFDDSILSINIKLVSQKILLGQLFFYMYF